MIFKLNFLKISNFLKILDKEKTQAQLVLMTDTENYKVDLKNYLYQLD